MGWYRKGAMVANAQSWTHELKDLRLWRALFCEFFGTFLLLFVGMMNIVASEFDTGKGKHIDNLLTPGLTFAGIIITLIHIVGPTSGCHLNPAVTISMVTYQRCNPLRGVLYIMVQIVGGVAGSALTYWIAPLEWVEETHLGMNRLNEDVSAWKGVVVEIVGTMILVLLVLVISDPDPKKDFEGFPSLSAGMMIMACVFFMAPYTGCSLNPARSFGPAFVMMDFASYHWIYWVGPIGGGLLAVGIFHVFLTQGIHHLSEAAPAPVPTVEIEENNKAHGEDKSEKVIEVEEAC